MEQYAWSLECAQTTQVCIQRHAVLKIAQLNVCLPLAKQSNEQVCCTFSPQVALPQSFMQAVQVIQDRRLQHGVQIHNGWPPNFGAFWQRGTVTRVQGVIVWGEGQCAPSSP